MTKIWKDWGAREAALGALGLVTVGVAALSISVSYEVLVPAFGDWAIPTVAALDTIWAILLLVGYLAGNNLSRKRPAEIAGLVLTVLVAAIPVAEVVMARGKVGLATIMAPVAIVVTKGVWSLVLPSLGRKVSPETRAEIAERRQQVADRLEVMEADAAHQEELLKVSANLQKRVSKAEAAYRKAVLAATASTTETLHAQATETHKVLEKKRLPVGVERIEIPVLGDWAPVTPRVDLAGVTPPAALPATPQVKGRGHARVTQATPEIEAVPEGVTEAVTDRSVLAQIASVAGVETPEPGERLSDEQMVVVLRYLRHLSTPPCSYRQAVTAFREAGFSGKEERVRRAWSVLVAREGAEEAEENA